MVKLAASACGNLPILRDMISFLTKFRCVLLLYVHTGLADFVHFDFFLSSVIDNSAASTGTYRAGLIFELIN